MAKPIKETPILKGSDAKRFIERKEHNDSKKADKEEIEKMNAGHAFIKKIAKI